MGASPHSEANRDSTVSGRIADTSYELFSRRGVRAVGVDTVVMDARVAKKTLYRYFPSKEALALAFLEERRRRWTHEWLERTIAEIAPETPERMLALFDALKEWFRQPDYEGCAFIRTLHEFPDGPLHEESRRQLEII